jgi:tetratricopeptide (TPR) repeat protein
VRHEAQGGTILGNFPAKRRRKLLARSVKRMSELFSLAAFRLWNPDAQRKISALPGGVRRISSFYSQSQSLQLALLSFVVCLSGTELARGQDTGLNDRFRQATEAMRTGRLDEAAEGFSYVIRASPAFAEAHLNLGLVCEEQGKNGEAIASFSKALTIKPRLRGANLFLGIAEYRLNELDKAIAALHKETNNYPADANAWMWLGVAELAKAQPEDAAEALDKAAKLAPTNVDILYHRGRAHLLVSKNSYEKMFKADPHSWRVHQVLAQADAESDRHTDAIAEYEAAIKLAPRQPGLHEELGIEYRNAGQIEAADAQFRAELDIDVNNTGARYKLGTLQLERGRPEEAKKLIESALQQNPNLPDAHYYLGRAQMQLGNDEAALASFKVILSSHPDSEIETQTYYQLANVYRRLHRMDESKAALAQFESLKQQSNAQQQQLYEKKRKIQETDRESPAQQP